MNATTQSAPPTASTVANLLLLPHILRQVGIPVALEQAMDFVQALDLIELPVRDQVYHAARATLINRFEHLRLFDLLFNRFWRFVGAPQSIRSQAPRGRHQKMQPQQRQDIVSLMAQRAGQAAQEVDITDKTGTYSASELLQRKEFATMTEAELAAIKTLILKMEWPISRRRTQRLTAHHQGQLDLRRLLRSAMQHQGVAIKLAYRQRKIKERPIVLLADISGSMEKYARLALQFFYGVSHHFQSVECFVFGTRLTRITAQLKVKNIDIALDEAARTVVDWSGGTRIGDSLQQFNRHWSRRVLRRGALIVMISDGWDRGESTVLQREMRYLQHRCHRLIWLNPLAGRTTYEAKVEGMATALRYVDDFLPLHNLQSLLAFSEHLAKLK